VAAPAPPPGPPPAKLLTEQYKVSHMGMTEREAQSVASQQSACVPRHSHPTPSCVGPLASCCAHLALFHGCRIWPELR
jgi:hypothetical protein